jgi:hypothetical protein
MESLPAGRTPAVGSGDARFVDAEGAVLSCRFVSAPLETGIATSLTIRKRRDFADATSSDCVVLQ